MIVYWYWYWYWLMPLFRVRQKLKLEMAETHMRRMRGVWGFQFCRPFPVPGKLGFFYVHTRSVHGAACLTSSSDGRRTRRYPKHETGQDGEDRKSPCPHRARTHDLRVQRRVHYPLDHGHQSK